MKVTKIKTKPVYSSKNMENTKVNFTKFIFGIKLPIANFYFFLALLTLFISSSITCLMEVLYGLSLNIIANSNMHDLKILCLIIGCFGFLNFLLCLLVGFLFKKHSDHLCGEYKRKYYGLIFKQEFDWFNQQDLNKLSESIKNDIEKIEIGVFNFFKIICLN